MHQVKIGRNGYANVNNALHVFKGYILIDNNHGFYIDSDDLQTLRNQCFKSGVSNSQEFWMWATRAFSKS